MPPTGNEAKRFSKDNHSTKAIQFIRKPKCSNSSTEGPVDEPFSAASVIALLVCFVNFFLMFFDSFFLTILNLVLITRVLSDSTPP